MNWFVLDDFGVFLFYMFVGGACIGLLLGLFRYLIFTWLERHE